MVTTGPHISDQNSEDLDLATAVSLSENVSDDDYDDSGSDDDSSDDEDYDDEAAADDSATWKDRRKKRVSKPTNRYKPQHQEDSGALVLCQLVAGKGNKRKEATLESQSIASTTGEDWSKCWHGKKRSRCKDCGGGSICEHQRQRSTCKDCGGGQICEHKRVKSQCKDCGGSQICEHKRRKSQCKDCKNT